MKIAFLYAGQGSQTLGMGKDLEEQEPIFAQMLNEVDPEGTYRAMMYGEDMDILSDTENTQPCMVSFAVAVTGLLKEKGLVPQMTAGLSLGEYSALVCAEVLPPKVAVDLVAFRGKVMAEGVEGIPSGMLAVLGLDAQVLQEVCEQCGSLGVVEIANYNCPGQLVVAGEEKAVEQVGKIAKERGAKRCISLNVSGPFHTSLMEEAGEKLREKLENVEYSSAVCPVVFNATGRVQGEETVTELLVKQIQSSVYFQSSIEKMLEEGIDTFIEIGPGAVLSGFVKKILKDSPKAGVSCYAVFDVDTLQKMLSELKI